MFEIIGSIIAGCFLGTLTGLVPGLHINLISVILGSGFITGNITLVVCIVSMSVVHSFVDFIPSICFGAPNEDNFLSILPGHRYLVKGNAYRGVMLTVVGGLFGIIFGLFLLGVFFLVAGKFFYGLRKYLAVLLLIVIGWMLLCESGKRKIWGIIVVILCSILGVIVLRGINFQQGVFAGITGLFGISTVFEAIITKSFTRRQSLHEFRVSNIKAVKNSLLSVFGGAFVAIIPGLGSNQAAFLIREISGKIKTSGYMILLGGINTVNIIFSFFAIYSIGKGRSGPAIIIQNLIKLHQEHLALIIISMVIAAGFGVIATITLARIILARIHSINYRSMNLFILIFITVMVFIISGFLGLLISVVGTAIGIIAIRKTVKRSLCMSFLIVPVTVFYLSLL